VRWIFPLLFFCLMNPVALVAAAGQDNSDRERDRPVKIHFFFAENCPHCREEKPFLETLRKKFPRLEITAYDVWKERENLELMAALSEAAGYEMISTPTTVLGDHVWIGFNTGIAEEIESKIRECLERDCPDDAHHLLGGNGKIEPRPPPEALERRTAPGDASSIDLPLFGQVETADLSLPALTLVLGLVDSFNPCAFFVLVFLLGLLVHAHSRRTMLVIGGTFVFFSGFIYFLFMAAWLNLFLIAGQMSAITRAAGLVALMLALINIKDFFFFKQGISLSISEKSKSRLFKRMRWLRTQASLPSILLGTVVLALAANSYELLCTAGFPMIYTRLLTMHNLQPWKHYAYLGLYNVVYVIPLLLIVIGFTVTLGARKMSEWQGRTLKLLSGIMMLMLALVLIVNPDLLSSLYYSLTILLLSLFLTWLVNILYHHHRLNHKAPQKPGPSPGEKIYRLEKRKITKKGRKGKPGA